MAYFSAVTSSLILLLLVLSVSSPSVHGNSIQSAKCSFMLVNMAGCIPFVKIGSTEDKPDSSCCFGLKTIIDTDASCLCEGFKKSGSMGIVLNVTKATTLPASCNLTVPPVSSCTLTTGPLHPPATAPAPVPVPVSAPTPPTPGPSSVPAPSPNHGSLLIPVSGWSFVISGALFILLI